MQYGRILCITGDTETPGRAERAAADLSRLSGGRLILLYVVEKCYNTAFLASDSPGWKTVHEMWLSEARALLDRKEEVFRAEGCYSIKKEIRCGERAYETVGVAMEQGASIIIAPKHMGWSVRGLLANSFANELSEHSPCPILWVNE